MTSKLQPGIHTNINLDKAGFFRAEKHLIWQLKQLWFVTFAKYQNFKGSDYSFAFLRPTEKVQEAFRLEREILVLISRYDNFDSRTLDFVDKLKNPYNNFVVIARHNGGFQKVFGLVGNPYRGLKNAAGTVVASGTTLDAGDGGATVTLTYASPNFAPVLSSSYTPTT